MAEAIFPPGIPGYVLCGVGKDNLKLFEVALLVDAADLCLDEGSVASLTTQLSCAEFPAVLALKLFAATSVGELLAHLANYLARCSTPDASILAFNEATESSNLAGDALQGPMLFIALVGDDAVELSRDGRRIATVTDSALVRGFRRIFWGAEPISDSLLRDMESRIAEALSEGCHVRARGAQGRRASSSCSSALANFGNVLGTGAIGDATELTIASCSVESGPARVGAPGVKRASVLSFVSLTNDDIARYIVEDSDPEDMRASSSGGHPGESLLNRGHTEIWRTLAVNDLVQLARGQQGSDVLWPREIGQVIQDRRHGSAPFYVRGPRGRAAWFPGEALVSAPRPRRASSFNKNGPRKPLVQQVIEVLNPQARLDFPKVTEICETAARNPDCADVATSVLVATLGEQKVKAGDSRNISQDYVKVLTIFNEMLYDDRLVDVLRQTPGLQPALQRLRNYRQGDLGSANDENIRMLANEIEKRVFLGTDGGRATKPTPRTEIIAFCPKDHLLVWQEGQGRFHIRSRHCALCNENLVRTMERYNCHSCRYYDVCVRCVRWGAPASRGAATPVREQPVQLDSLANFLGEATPPVQPSESPT